MEAFTLSLLTMMISFAPWLILKIVSGLPFADPLTMLKLSLFIAFPVCLFQSRKNTEHGFIFWGTLLFFSFGFVFVILLSNAPVIRYFGVLAQLSMNLMVWGSMLSGRPFTVEYAERGLPEPIRTRPDFLRKHYLITGAWGLYFLLGLFSEEIRIYEPHTSGVLIEIIDTVSMMGAELFTGYISKPPKGGPLPDGKNATA